MAKGFKHGAGGGAGNGGTLVVSSPASVTVTLSNGVKTYTKVSDSSGQAVFKGLPTGTWTLTITNGAQTATQTVKITSDYSAVIAFFAATISVTYPSGSTCSATDGTITLTAPDTSGVWECIVPNAGTWTITAVNGENTLSKQVEITDDGQSESTTLLYQYLIYNGASAADYTGDWNGRGTDTDSALVMSVIHHDFSGNYRSAGWKFSTEAVTIPSGASVMKMTYSTSGGFSSLTTRVFGFRTSAYSGGGYYDFEGGTDKFVAYVSMSAGTDVTVSVPITQAIEGNSYYVAILAYTGNTEINATVTISKIWIE